MHKISYNPSRFSSSVEHRFFCSISTLLPKSFITLLSKPDPHKVKALMAYQEKSSQIMRDNFPHVMEDTFKPPKMVYRLCDLPPEEMIANGGFNTSSSLYIFRSGNNTGSICFSLLPEVTTLFNETIPKGKKRYLYACLLNDTYFAPGGKWRQIIVPGACPIPSTWMAKEVLTISNDRHLIMGPMVGQVRHITKELLGDSFHEFSQDILKMPTITDYGHEDQEMEFEIIDTSESRQFQDSVEKHYSNVQSTLSLSF